MTMITRPASSSSSGERRIRIGFRTVKKEAKGLQSPREGRDLAPRFPARFGGEPSLGRSGLTPVGSTEGLTL